MKLRLWTVLLLLTVCREYSAPLLVSSGGLPEIPHGPIHDCGRMTGHPEVETDGRGGATMS